MLLTTDSLTTSDLKYEIMKDEKCDPAKEEKIDLIKEEGFQYVTTNHRTCRMLYIVLIGIAFTAAMWITLLPRYHDQHPTHDFNTTFLTDARKTLNETEVILNKVQESVNIIAEDNLKKASEYVTAIQDMLQDRTKYAITKINQIVIDKIREIENELTSFDYVITEASGGIVDYTVQDIGELRESFSTSNATYQTDFEKLFDGVKSKITSAFTDLDSMYTFYGSYMNDIISNKVQNATDRISMVVNSERKMCECTIKEKINFCYTMSKQNQDVSKQLEKIVKVLGIIYNTTDVIDTMEPAILDNANQQQCSLLSEAKLTLNKAEARAEDALKSILENDQCFLGTAVRKAAYSTHDHFKKTILNGFESSIQNLAKNLNDTTTGFKVVQEKHWKEVQIDLNAALTSIGDEIRAQLSKVYHPQKEYSDRAEFSDLKVWMDNKFHNATAVINPMFENKQQIVAETLKYTLQYIIFQQVPFASTLSIQNYLPTDVCPLATDFQRFLSITLDPFQTEDMQGGLSQSANYMETKVKLASDNEKGDTEQASEYLDLIPSSDKESQQVNNDNTVYVEQTDSFVQMLDNIVEGLINSDGENIDDPVQITITEVHTMQEEESSDK